MRLFFLKRIQVYKKFTETLTQKSNKIDFIQQGHAEKNEVSFVRQITHYVIINVKENMEPTCGKQNFQQR